MFRGSFQTKVDPKGRLKVPTDFRRTLEERWGSEVFFTSIHGDCARLYPLPVWEEIEAKLAAVPASHAAKLKLLERVNHFGQQLQLDAQGRVVVPPLLRASAGIAGDVVVSGRLQYLEIWNRERFEKRLTEEPFTAQDLAALAEQGV